MTLKEIVDALVQFLQVLTACVPCMWPLPLLNAKASQPASNVTLMRVTLGVVATVR